MEEEQGKKEEEEDTNIFLKRICGVLL